MPADARRHPPILIPVNVTIAALCGAAGSIDLNLVVPEPWRHCWMGRKSILMWG